MCEGVGAWLRGWRGMSPHINPSFRRTRRTTRLNSQQNGESGLKSREVGLRPFSEGCFGLLDSEIVRLGAFS